MITSYHVHSTYSDGERPIPELVDGAVSLGLDELGFSDHYVLFPDRRELYWSIPHKDLGKYFEEITAIAEESAGRMVIKRGLEADFIPDTIDDLKEILGGYPFDYIIGSVHFVDGMCIDESAETWLPISQNDRNDIIRTYWSNIAKMAACGLFSFAGHLDLYKKFCIKPTIDISTDIETALDAIATAGMAVELNTAGWNKNVHEAYPSQFILSECHRRKIPVLITADAHHPTHLTRDYDKAESLIRSIGYNETAIFSAKNMKLVAL